MAIAMKEIDPEEICMFSFIIRLFNKHLLGATVYRPCGENTL